MIEMVVVVIILGVLALAVVPRLISVRGREVQAAAERVAELLSTAARRDSLLSQRLAVEFDGDAGSLRLVTMTAPGADVATLPEWRSDPLVPGAELGDVKLVEATSDGSALDRKHWRVELPQNTVRPAIGLVLSDAAGVVFWRVDLPPRGTRAEVTSGKVLPPGAAEGAGFLDLDALGQGESAW